MSIAQPFISLSGMQLHIIFLLDGVAMPTSVEVIILYQTHQII
jgi:hypothetical protein